MRNVLVTGGSRGIGLAIARRLVDAGYSVIAVARRESAELTALRGASPGSVHFRAVDLGDTDGLAALVKDVRTEVGPLWGLVNNAGIGTSGLLATLREAEIERLVRVNTLSPILLTRHALRAMLAAGKGGRIVNIASIVAATGFKGLAPYAATKASLVGFTRSLAREVGGAGITVNAVAPGFIETDMTHSLTEAQRAQVLRRSALGRPADADAVAASVEFLLSDKAAAITGTVLTVDGGSTA